MDCAFLCSEQLIVTYNIQYHFIIYAFAITNFLFVIKIEMKIAL